MLRDAATHQNMRPAVRMIASHFELVNVDCDGAGRQRADLQSKLMPTCRSPAVIRSRSRISLNGLGRAADRLPVFGLGRAMLGDPPASAEAEELV